MKRRTNKTKVEKRQYDREFKEQAVRMLIEGQSASEIVSRLGISGTNLLYRWKKALLARDGVLAGDLEVKVRTLQDQVRQLERERDILKKALAIFSRNG